MMAARELDRLRLAEYQAIVDLCAAFQPAGFDGGSHYQRVDPSDARLTAVLADNAADPQPSYARLLSRLIESGVLARRAGRVSLTVCAPRLLPYFPRYFLRRLLPQVSWNTLMYSSTVSSGIDCPRLSKSSCSSGKGSPTPSMPLITMHPAYSV